MPSDGKSSHCLWQGELKIDAASFHRCLLFGRDGIFHLTNSFFSMIYVLYKLYFVNSPPPKPEVILTNFFAEPTVLLCRLPAVDKLQFLNTNASPDKLKIKINPENL
jgi:hypothetical protein